MTQWNPADYHAHSQAQQAWARELIAKLDLKPDDQVLDIGCGDGKVTAEIAALLPRGRVLGIDSSAEMIRFARLEFPTLRCPNLRFEIVDASGMSFADEFDAVFSNAALHWIIDHRPVLAGIVRALKPGGRLLLQMAGRGNAAAILQLLDEILPSERWREHFPQPFPCPYGFYAPPEYRTWLAQAGLVAERAELIPKDMIHADAESMAAWIRTTWLPYTEHVPAELRPAFIQELVQTYLERYPPDAQGRIHLQMVRLEVEAVKPE